MSLSEAPARPAAALPVGASPLVQMRYLDTLWFQVGGTLCNLACAHCFVSCSPTNHTHEMMTLEQITPYLLEGAGLGVKEYYFTGGEPFLNPEMEPILYRALELGTSTGLTNGLLMIGVALALPLITMSARMQKATVYGLVYIGWANTAFYWFGNAAASRALSFGDNPLGASNLLGAIGFGLAFVGALLIIWLLIYGKHQMPVNPAPGRNIIDCARVCTHYS